MPSKALKGSVLKEKIPIPAPRHFRMTVINYVTPRKDVD